MPDSIPSIILYGQALAFLKDLQDSYSTGATHTVDNVAAQLGDVLTKFESSLGQPVLQFDPVADFEPPSSDKMNLFWTNTTTDIALLQQQIDVLRAATVFTHNFIKTETSKASLENATVNNKLKTLQMYSDSVDPSIVVFGDSFHSDEFVDLGFVAPDGRAAVVDGVLTLGRLGDLKNLTRLAEIQILDEANGFLGNNQEIENPQQISETTATGTTPYVFIAEKNRAANLAAIVDGDPNTWIEYEHCLISSSDRLSVSNLNFTYSETDPTSNETVEVDWADGPPGGKLEFGLQFDLQSPQLVNYFSYTPYGLVDNANSPVLVKKVETSLDETNWLDVLPTNLWIGTEANLRAASTADQVSLGTAVWSFESRSIQFIRIHVEQPNSIARPIGHLYYIDNTTGNRVKGPVPTVEHPDRYYQSDITVINNATVHREYFNGQRWAIGIRDMLALQIQYQTTSTMVSKTIQAGGVVDRIALEADYFVPTTFPKDTSWIEFYISPNNGTSWFQISSIKDDFLKIPEVIAFNDPLPDAFHEPGVAYYSVSGSVTSLRLKVILKRPPDQTPATPVLKSYKLKIRRR